MELSTYTGFDLPNLTHEPLQAALYTRTITTNDRLSELNSTMIVNHCWTSYLALGSYGLWKNFSMAWHAPNTFL